MWQMHDGWGWWMAMGLVWMVALWGLIIWAVYAVVTRLERNGDRQQLEGPDALAILERRYARGELATEQFEEMRGQLGYLEGHRAKSA